MGGLRRVILSFVESKGFTTALMTLILINAVTLGMETSDALYDRYGPALEAIDKAILIVFTIELGLKLFAYRWGFFRSGWNIFDFLIVAISWAPASGTLAVLRSLRILRVLRLLSIAPQLRRVVSAVGDSIPGMTSVIGVLAIVFYISSVLATNLFGDHPAPEMREWFGTIGASAYTLFQIMTLESWSMGVVRPVMAYYPWAWVFFVPFIFVTSFAVLNLFIGIIVDSMASTHRDEEEASRDSVKQHTHDEILALHERFDRIERQLERLARDQADKER